MIQNLKNQAADIVSIDDFKQWVRTSIRAVFPHEALACGYGRMHAGGIYPDYILSVDFPEQHFKEICNPAGGLDSSLLERWLNTCDVVLFDPAHPCDWPELTPEWLAHFLRSDLRNAAAHAVLDTQRFVGTYFSFHRLPALPSLPQVQQLKVVIAAMHEALVRVIHNIEEEDGQTPPAWDMLSFKELQVAVAIGCGKSNQEIAQYMRQSENTVKHHASRILKKFSIASRAQLIATIAKFPPGYVTKGTRVL